MNLGEYLQIDGYSAEEISFHVLMVEEAGLVEARKIASNRRYAEYRDDVVHIPVRLTWWGHEFLEAVRDDNRWHRTKAIMAKVGGFVFELAKPLALDLMKEQITQLVSQF